MLHTSKRACRIGPAVQFSYSVPFKMAAHMWKYAEILPANDVTCTPSIGRKFVVDITVHCILYQGGWLDAPLTVQSFSHKGYSTLLSLSVCRYCWDTAGSVGGRRCCSEAEKCTRTGTHGRWGLVVKSFIKRHLARKSSSLVLPTLHKLADISAT